MLVRSSRNLVLSVEGNIRANIAYQFTVGNRGSQPAMVSLNRLRVYRKRKQYRA